MEGDPKIPQGASMNFPDIGILDVLDSLPFYVMLIDRNHRILLVNQATRNRLQREPDEILGKFCPKVVHGLDEDEVYPGCPLAEAVETGAAVEHEHFDKKQGIWVRTAVYPTRSYMPDGERIYLHMIVDITDQKNAREELSRSEEKYRLLLEELIKT